MRLPRLHPQSAGAHCTPPPPPMAIAISTSGALSQNLAPPHQEAGVDGDPKRYAQALTPSTHEHVTLFGNRVSADVIKLRISR